MSHAAAFEIDAAEPEPVVRRPRAPANILLASLAGALVTTCLSGASLVYAFTHIPEVDPDAEAAPVAAVAEINAEAPVTPTKLEVLTPPVYGSDMISEAPAAAFVPVSAQVQMDPATVNAIDPYAVAQTDGDTPPCADPCTAQAGYVTTDGTPDAQTPAAPPVRTDSRVADTGTDDDGNAPPPPGMAVN